MLKDSPCGPKTTASQSLMPVQHQKAKFFLLVICAGVVSATGYLFLGGLGESKQEKSVHRQEMSPSAQVVESPVETPPQPDDPAITAAVEKLGGHTITDRFGRVTKVILHRCPVTDADLVLLRGLTELRTLNLRGASCVGPGITDAGLVHLADLPNLQVLELSVNPGITSDGLKSLKNLKRLTTLNLFNTHVTNEGLTHLQGCSSLKRLNLPCPVGPRSVLRWPRPGGGGCTQEGLPALWGLPIEELNGLFLYEEGFQYLQGLNHLRQLAGDFGDPEDTELIYLKDFAKLESVAVGLSEGWQNTSRLRWIRGMRSLKTLQIAGKPTAFETFDSDGLQVLAELPVLTRLRLGRITDAGMAHLPTLPGVRVLDLSISQIRGPGLAHLNRFPNLEFLALDPTTLNNEGLAHLPKLPGLRTLYLDGTPFRGKGLSYLCPKAEQDRSLKNHLGYKLLASLKRVPELEELSLFKMPITDAGLAHLRQTPNLKILNVAGTKVTDQGLVHIRGLENLRKFAVEGTSIGFDAATALHQALPRCYISDNWCCGCLAFQPVESSQPAP